MLDKKDDCSCHSCRKDELIEELLFYDWSLEALNISRTFLLLLNAYLGSEDCDSANPETRQEVAFHLVMMQNTIEKLQQLQSINHQNLSR